MKRFLLPAFLLLLSVALPAQERYRWFHHIQVTPDDVAGVFRNRMEEMHSYLYSDNLRIGDNVVVGGIPARIINKIENEKVWSLAP